jgi:putative transposase
MTNHVHLLITPLEEQAVSLMMMDLGRRYVRYFNDLHDRTGTLWEGRFRSSLVETRRYCLACHRYIELNPVRAGMVPEPGEYRWSSYRCNALGVPSSLITPHSEWLALGANDRMRRKAYLKLFDRVPGEQELKAIRRALRKGRPVGGKRFQQRIEANLDLELGDGNRGRPRKEKGVRFNNVKSIEPDP